MSEGELQAAVAYRAAGSRRNGADLSTLQLTDYWERDLVNHRLLRGSEAFSGRYT